MTKKPKNAWIVVEKGLKGTLNQGLGIAQHLEIPYEIKEISLRQPWRFLSPYIDVFPCKSLKQSSAKLLPPWPDLVISGGRKSIALSLMAKRKSKGETFVTHLLDPKIKRRNFDLIITPKHDEISGPNIFQTIGAPNLITETKLKEEADKLKENFKNLKETKIAVLIGGSTKDFKYFNSLISDMATTLETLAHKYDASLLITTSRRTPKHHINILRTKLKDTSHVIWDGENPNPYFAYLALSDYIIVTQDSVSMISEAATAGKPVFVYDLGITTKRINGFKRNIVEHGSAKIFNGDLGSFKPSPLNDAKDAASQILKRYNAYYE